MNPSGMINWYVNASFDEPSLRSPQPCTHGSGCAYTTLNPTTNMMTTACCAFVHPGEEGNGRRLFPAREIMVDGVARIQPACVRLTGGAGYYERRRNNIPWYDWCQMKGIPHRAHLPGEIHAPVIIIPIGKAVSEVGMVTPHRRPMLSGPPKIIRQRHVEREETSSPGSATAPEADAFPLDLEAGMGMSDIANAYNVALQAYLTEFPMLSNLNEMKCD